MSETITVTLDKHAAKMVKPEGDMAAITSRNSELSNALENLNSKASVLEDRLQDLQSQNDMLQDSFTSLQCHLDRVSMKANDSEQYSRRGNVRVFRIVESPDEDCEDAVLTLFQSKLDISISKSDIDRCHRVGSNRPGKPRAIIVKVASYKVKWFIVKNRRKLKGWKIIITEGLTKENLILLNKVRESPGVISAWSMDGRIFAKIEEGNIKLIKKLTDLI